MRTRFIAQAVPVLNFSRLKDSQGSIIPPEAHATFGTTIPVLYGPEDSEYTAGRARLWRVSNRIIADINLNCTWAYWDKAEGLIRKLYPAACFRVLECVNDTIFKFHIEALTLTPHGNADHEILPLGARLVRLPRGTEVN